MNFRDKLDPEYDPRPYEQVPKVRGVFVSLLISLAVWVFAAAVLASALYIAGNIWIYICDGHFPKGSPGPLGAFMVLLAFSLIIELLAHQCPYICFLGCRTWPSLAKVILFSLVGRRYGACGNAGCNRISRINIMGY